ncbi:MAG: aldo/keto reductase [Chlamydiae bacterium]|nr:aldo/keto reductase [Chlamydiota bacterium]
MNKHNIIRGCWQLATGHSQVEAQMEPILDAINCGFTTFDCADIYLGVEELLGKALRAASTQKLRIHTKFVPDLDCLQAIDYRYVESIINRSLTRLHVDCLDLVQFHWWDWRIKNYLPTLEYLFQLKAKGKIAQIGLTNVNTQYLEEISGHFDIASLQVQVSLFDRRIEQGVANLCKQKNIKIFAYGSLLGGFVNEKWLYKKEPEIDQLVNRSLVKYKLLIDAACGWQEFQLRLSMLSELAKKYHCDVANIAVAALLQSAKVDAIIIGLSPQNFAFQNRSLEHLPRIEASDLQLITTWPCNLHGDIYEEERDEHRAHAKIMKYNLNAQ